MRNYLIVYIFLVLFAQFACGGSKLPETPFETLQTYTQAIKKKDAEKMKALLSKGSIKMAEDEAKANNISIEDVILRETLISPDQKKVKFKNEKIDGENASIEVESSPDVFDRLPFVKEDGIWKIAKDKYAEEFLKQSEEDDKRLNEQINNGKPPE